MTTALNSKLLPLLFTLFQLVIFLLYFETNCRQAVELVVHTNSDVDHSNGLEQSNGTEFNCASVSNHTFPSNDIS